jgi:hypothetical protein
VYVRVVRFTNVKADHHDDILIVWGKENEVHLERPDVSVVRAELSFDTAQETAVYLHYFETAETMEASARVFRGIEDGSETHASRASVDMCEVDWEMRLST